MGRGKARRHYRQTKDERQISKKLRSMNEDARRLRFNQALAEAFGPDATDEDIAQQIVNQSTTTPEKENHA